MSCALARLPVVLLDAKPDALDKAVASIGKNMDRQVAKEAITADQRAAAMAGITASTDYAAFAGADLVIEAATEKEDVKHAIFRTLVPHLKPSAMIASNTSSISITRLAAGTDRPGKVIGMHFMNPVPVMKLVEVIRGIATDEPTFQAVQALAARLDKITAVSEDFPGFIVNRILLPMINEAVYALYEGVGTISGIDSALRLGAAHKMGPFELADFIGAGYVSEHHAGAAQRAVRQQVPPLPTAREVCGGRVVWAKGRAGILRLFGNATASDALTAPSPSGRGPG